MFLPEDRRLGERDCYGSKGSDDDDVYGGGYIDDGSGNMLMRTIKTT